MGCHVDRERAHSAPPEPASGRSDIIPNYRELLGYELFDEEMRTRAIHRRTVENDLRRALGRGELRLVYQPVVALRDRSIASVEALGRWAHPSRGLVLPGVSFTLPRRTG